MPAIDVVSDASVALKWFHDEGEEEVDAARGLLQHYGQRRIRLMVLDHTRYEVGNALLRGPAHLTADRVAIVLDALREICPEIAPTPHELREAATLAERFGLTLYDASYAAVAAERRAELVTLDRALLKARLGRRPSEVLAGLQR